MMKKCEHCIKKDKPVFDPCYISKRLKHENCRGFVSDKAMELKKFTAEFQGRLGL